MSFVRHARARMEQSPYRRSAAYGRVGSSRLAAARRAPRVACSSIACAPARVARGRGRPTARVRASSSVARRSRRACSSGRHRLRRRICPRAASSCWNSTIFDSKPRAIRQPPLDASARHRRIRRLSIRSPKLPAASYNKDTCAAFARPRAAAWRSPVVLLAACNRGRRRPPAAARRHRRPRPPPTPSSRERDRAARRSSSSATA